MITTSNKNKIKQLWVFTTTDNEGMEGILAAPIGPNGTLTQMIATDAKDLEPLRKYAAALQLKNTSRKINLISFVVRRELE